MWFIEGVRGNWPHLSADKNGAFYLALPAGRYELRTVAPFYYTPYICVPYRFEAPQPGKAYYLGALRVEFESTVVLGGLWGNYIDSVDYVEVLDQFDAAAAALAARGPGAAALPIEKALMTRIPGRRPATRVPMPLNGFLRRGAALATALALAACATEPPRPLLAAREGRVALVAARFEPQTNFNAYAQGKGAAAGSTGAEWAAGGAAAGALAPLSGSAVLYPYIAPFTILAGALLGGAAGGIQGARHGLYGADAAAVHKAVGEAFAALKVQESVAARIAEAAAGRGRPLERDPAVQALAPSDAKQEPDYKAVLGAPYAAVLECAVTSVRVVAKKGDPPRVALEIALRVRGVDAGGTTTRNFLYKSRPEPVARWAGNGGALIRSELEAGYRELADDVAATMTARRTSASKIGSL